MWSNPLPLPSIDPQWGWGVTHAKQWGVQQCQKCHGAGYVGRKPLMVLCPKCGGQDLANK